MTDFMLLFSFVFGLIVGSFLNVVIFRLEPELGDANETSGNQGVFGTKKEKGNTGFPYGGSVFFGLFGVSLFGGRSHCPLCKTQLKWFELIPIVSFAVQRARCNTCGGKISWQYPLVELGTGVMFMLIMWQYLGGNIVFAFLSFVDIFIPLYYFLFASLLIVAFAYDFRHTLLPDFVAYGILALYFLRITYSLLFSSPPDFQASIYDLSAALGVFFVFFGIWFFSGGRAMGFGDVKLAPVIALFLGFPDGLVAILLSFWMGSIVGLFLIILTKMRNFRQKETGFHFGLKSEIPFGPFLVLGAFVALLWGNQLVQAYFSLMYNI